jgi:hypothetical protein
VVIWSYLSPRPLPYVITNHNDKRFHDALETDESGWGHDFDDPLDTMLADASASNNSKKKPARPASDKPKGSSLGAKPKSSLGAKPMKLGAQKLGAQKLGAQKLTTPANDEW